MLNLSALFFTTLDQPHFHDELDLTTEEKTFISKAKTDVRNALRRNLSESISLELRKHGLPSQTIEPKFYIQGSWAYKTLNRPCQTPPQQSDLDDGVYLPMSIVKGQGRPSVASALFFEAAELALSPLARENNWEVIKKPTCIRIEISDFAHIDIPLYAIPDDEFLVLRASMEARNSAVFDSVKGSVPDRWAALPTDKVLLAHRTENWLKSDPRAMNDWFVQEVEDKGIQFRRIVRYLKAFRDMQWPVRGPSSILLMAASAMIFEGRHARDDLALVDVLEKLPGVLREGVVSPIDDEIYLTDALTADDLEDAALKYEEFHKYLRAAINCSNQEQACVWVGQMLGKRFPIRPDLIVAATAASVVTSAAAEPGPLELAKTTKAG